MSHRPETTLFSQPSVVTQARDNSYPLSSVSTQLSHRPETTLHNSLQSASSCHTGQRQLFSTLFSQHPVVTQARDKSSPLASVSIQLSHRPETTLLHSLQSASSVTQARDNSSPLSSVSTQLSHRPETTLFSQHPVVTQARDNSSPLSSVSIQLSHRPETTLLHSLQSASSVTQARDNSSPLSSVSTQLSHRPETTLFSQHPVVTQARDNSSPLSSVSKQLSHRPETTLLHSLQSAPSCHTGQRQLFSTLFSQHPVVTQARDNSSPLSSVSIQLSHRPETTLHHSLQSINSCHTGQRHLFTTLFSQHQVVIQARDNSSSLSSVSIQLP